MEIKVVGKTTFVYPESRAVSSQFIYDVLLRRALERWPEVRKQQLEQEASERNTPR